MHAIEILKADPLAKGLSRNSCVGVARCTVARVVAKGLGMAKSVDDRGRGARMARRDEGAYCSYVTEEQRSQ